MDLVRLLCRDHTPDRFDSFQPIVLSLILLRFFGAFFWCVAALEVQSDIGTGVAAGGGVLKDQQAQVHFGTPGDMAHVPAAVSHSDDAAQSNEKKLKNRSGGQPDMDGAEEDTLHTLPDTQARVRNASANDRTTNMGA